ncbi:MAG: DUF512 domain-containing protein [Candidatus Limiplasma sp.]|nr:DUF512 domain-containing protein [Candidatus Limiplasma sp.]
MRHEITAVDPHSVAKRVGFQPGDWLLTLNGEEIEDEIDYQALIAGARVEARIERNGRQMTLHIHKMEGEPLGLHFGSTMDLSPRTCRNNCIFCFIAQMPPGLRETLYVKDDDWRYSLMMGNFLTLTNMSEKEFQRVLKRRPSPLYISVHTTNPDLRCKMLHNRFAGNIMDKLRRFKEAGIHFHCQIVVCPGYNDGQELLRTLHDLRTLAPATLTVAMVPVGLTRFREKLTQLKPFSQQQAAALLDLIAPFQEECRRTMGTTFAFPSDEFYCLAGRPIPEESWYEDFPQIENGVGLLRRLESEMEEADDFERRFGGDEPAPQKTYLIPTGVSAAPHLNRMARRFAPEGVHVRVLPVINRFFGDTITVTGLLTGGDVLDALTPEVVEGVDEILLCSVMLRSEGDLFLDDMHIDTFRQRAPRPVHVTDNDGQSLYDALRGRFTD